MLSFSRELRDLMRVCGIARKTFRECVLSIGWTARRHRPDLRARGYLQCWQEKREVRWRERGLNLLYIWISLDEGWEGGKNESHLHSNIFSRTKSNLNYLRLLFFNLYPIYFSLFVCSQGAYCLSSNLLSLFLYLSPSPHALFWQPLMGAISPLNTCRCLQGFGRDEERKRDGDKERKTAVAGCSGPLRHDIKPDSFC